MTARRKTRPPSRTARLAGEFVGGLTDLSALSLWIALTLAALVAAFTLWFFSPATMAGPMGRYVPTGYGDADAFAMIEALRLAHAPPERPTLVLAGSSAIAQITGDGRAIETALAEAPLGPWKVAVVTTPAQSPFDQMRLLETILDVRDEQSPPMVVAIGVSLLRVGWTTERLVENERGNANRVPLDSAWVDARLAAAGRAPAPEAALPFWGVENFDFVLLHAMRSYIRLALLRPSPRRVDIYGDFDMEGPIARLPARVEAGLAEEDIHFERLAAQAERILAAPGVRLVFVEEPLAPAFLEATGLAPVRDAYLERARAVARRVGADYWVPVDDTTLAPEEFADAVHVARGPGQRRVRMRIVDQMSGLAARMEAAR